MDTQQQLNRKLGPEYISQRPGPGGGPKFTYVEGWRIINLANQVFGFDGWSSSVVSLTTDYIDYSEESHRYSVGVSALVRVTLSQNGASHEDVGYGTLENSKSKGAALDKCKKEAITDGLKRALRNFGNLLGNCLYDKAYTQQVIKLKASQPVFDASELYHGPEPDLKWENGDVDVKPARSIGNTTTTPVVQPSVVPRSAPVTPAPAIPPHLRTTRSTGLPDSRPTPGPSSNTPVNPAHTGLVTPAKTPDSRVLQSGNHTRPSAPHPNPTNPTTRPPNAQPQIARVSFADSPTTIPSGPDSTQNLPEATNVSSATAFTGIDEFSFSSEDDAFYAGIDLGDADLGRPIDFEDGLGHMHRSHDESVLGVHGLAREGQANSSTHNASVRAAAPSKPNTTSMERVVAVPAREAPVRVPLNDVSLSKPSAKTSNPSDDWPRFAISSSTAGAANANQTSSKTGNETGKEPMNPNARMISDNATTSRQKESSAAAHSSTSGVSAQTTKRQAASSMGGFNFPPGVNPFRAQQTPVSTTSSGMTIGVKRPAENTLPRRPPQYGMGLAQQQQQHQLPLKREPLGRLDIPEHNDTVDGGAGDAKRLRR